MVILGTSIALSTNDAKAYTVKGDYVITETDGIYYGDNGYKNPVPNIIVINPNYGYLNSGEKTITITGNNFIRGSVARFNGTNRPTAYIDSTRLQMKLSPADMTNLGAHKISVWNPLPGGGFSNAVAYNVIRNTTGQVQGASTTKAVAKKVSTTPKKTASIVLAKGTEYRISCEDDNGANYLGSVGGDSTNGSDEYYGNQSANVLSSDSNFLPNTLLEWLFLAFLVFLVVVIWRKVTRTDAEKHAPLKHA